MKRYLLLVLFVLVLFAPFALRRVLVQAEEQPRARGTGAALELVILTPHNQDIRRAFAAAFSDWHLEHHSQPVRVTYLTPGGTNDIVRLLYDTYDAMRDAQGQLPPRDQVNISYDMMWGGGDYAFEVELKPRGILQPITLDRAILLDAFPEPDIGGVPLYEPVKDGVSPQWVGVCLSSFGIIYNPTFLRIIGMDPPTTWEHLADERLAGLVALADPTRSGSAAVTYMMPVQRAMVDAENALLRDNPELANLPKAELVKRPEYQQAISAGWKRGMATMLRVAANARYFTDSASQVPNDVGRAEAAAGVAIDFYARVYEQMIGSDRIRYVAPQAATAINPDPIAVLYGVRGQREVLANRFIEFLLTPEAQHLWNIEGQHTRYLDRSLRRLPIRRDVYADRSKWADDVNPFEESAGFNLRQDWQRLLFSDMRPIWAAAWIDTRAALKNAYAQVLRVRDDRLRRELIEELANLPIEMQDVIDQRTKRRQLMEEKQDVRFWMAQQRIGWARTFRNHYASVAAKARNVSARSMDPMPMPGGLASNVLPLAQEASGSPTGEAR